MTSWVLILAVSMNVDNRARSEVEVLTGFETRVECQTAGAIAQTTKPKKHKVSWLCLNLKRGPK